MKLPSSNQPLANPFPHTKTKPKINAEVAAEKFEQLLISNILKQSRKPTFEGILPNKNNEFFNGLLDNERSILISNSVDLQIADSLKKGNQ